MTSTELGRPLTVVSPITGELIQLDADDATLAGYLADVREHESLLREAKTLVGSELLRRMDAAATWTIHLPNSVTITAPSPAPGEEFDELALRTALLELADEGVITPSAVDRAVEPVVTYKTHAVGIRALRKLGGRVAAVVDFHARPVEKRRYVTVDRSR
jgi:hypothetical protein